MTNPRIDVGRIETMDPFPTISRPVSEQKTVIRPDSETFCGG
jgi:hypothetical protein